MDATFFEDYKDSLKNRSVLDLHQEQDRIMTVIHRLNGCPRKPYKMLDMLERKLHILEEIVSSP